MFFRFIIVVIVVVTFNLWSPEVRAQGSQTASFTLSITIPEHAEVAQPAGLNGPLNEFVSPNRSSRVQMQQDERENKTVMLASYVVD